MDRKAAYTLPGCREDRIRNCRRNRRHTAFAGAARCLAAGDYVNLDLRHLGHRQQRIIAKPGLCDMSAFDRNRGFERRGEAEGDRTLDLGADRIRIHGKSAIDRADYAMDRNAAVVANGYLSDLSGPSTVRVVDGRAARMSGDHRPPAGFARGEFEHGPMARRPREQPEPKGDGIRVWPHRPVRR